MALARAIVNKPAVLLLDEPLGALDLKLRRQMQVELKRIQTEVGLTFVHVTHDQEEAMTMADAIAVMNAGRIEQLGAPAELYENPATTFAANFLGQSNLIAPPSGTGRPDAATVALPARDGPGAGRPAAAPGGGSLGRRPAGEDQPVPRRGIRSGTGRRLPNRIDGARSSPTPASWG